MAFIVRAPSHGILEIWISLRMNGYLLRLATRGLDAQLPNLSRSIEMIIRNCEDTFPTIPEQYLVPTRPQRALGQPAPAKRAPGQPVPGDRTARDPNPRLVQAIVDAFRAINLPVSVGKS
jgi:hypothetical protein